VPLPHTFKFGPLWWGWEFTACPPAIHFRVVLTAFNFCVTVVFSRRL
jgi:hypothetical protein